MQKNLVYLYKRNIVEKLIFPQIFDEFDFVRPEVRLIQSPIQCTPIQLYKLRENFIIFEYFI